MPNSTLADLPSASALDGTESVYLVQSGGDVEATTLQFRTYAWTAPVTFASGTLTASSPVLTTTQTWNNGAVQFKAGVTDVADTASAGNSLLHEWQIGGAGVAGVLKDGALYSNFGLFKTPAELTGFYFIDDLQIRVYTSGSGNPLAEFRDVGRATPAFALANTHGVGWASGPASNGPIDTLLSRVAPGVVGFGKATVGAPDGWQQWGGQARVSTQFDKTSSATLADVPGLSVALTAGRTYSFRVVLFTSSNVAGGVKAAMAGTATATAIVYEGWNINANAMAGQTRATALGTAVAATTAVTVAKVEIEGTITVNAAGTLTVQFAQNAANAAASSVLVGSYMTVWDMP